MGNQALFYPAAGYPHKNHKILNDMENFEESSQLINEMCITLKYEEKRHFPMWVNNLGRLSSQACGEYYQSVDALFFPSLTESYGLPLIEAMICGLPIVCADLDYAHCVCGEQAIYFDPDDPVSAIKALVLLRCKLATGWQPDWSIALAKLPASWDEVVQKFLKLLEK
ncbi:glycosyltransferase [sulfur-oxidizing endosymbiont of Gigantopelta aegis]|uniref:glycosyltransferase n=1 Tax=sulfur-oxidizing endosymbiont of Gigantopelta aegis TaxID=2794934 RepID=UPI0018DE8062|nr:glycosyltransferase [sulfur-oxidizing endosymbiont of Gigantopelta aegis]